MLAAGLLKSKRLMAALTMLGMMCWGWAPAPTSAAEVVAGAIQSRDLDYSESASFGRNAEALRRLAE